MLTIHKTQGGEYRTVLIPMTLSHFIMLNNKLLYTAVTRAKEKVVPVGEDYAFRSACREKDVTVRDTVLKMLPVASPARRVCVGTQVDDKRHEAVTKEPVALTKAVVEPGPRERLLLSFQSSRD